MPITSPDRKSTRLNSSHLGISYAVFCLKKEDNNRPRPRAAPPEPWGSLPCRPARAVRGLGPGRWLPCPAPIGASARLLDVLFFFDGAPPRDDHPPPLKRPLPA